MSGKFYKGAPQPAPTATNPTSPQVNNTQPAPIITPVPVINSRSNSITPAPSESGDSKNDDPFEDAFNSNSPSRNSSTPSPTPSLPQHEKVQHEKTGAKPAKKPLVLKKTAPKKDPFLAEMGGDDWGDLDNSSFSNSTSLKPAKEPVKKPTASTKPKQSFEVKNTSKDDGNNSDGDWDTKW